jgi:hypothetical protein
MSKDIGNIKIKEAAQHLAAQQKADKAAVRASEKAAHQAQTTKLKIAGNLRGPLLHQNALQKSLMKSPDYLVPAKLIRVKPALSR